MEVDKDLKDNNFRRVFLMWNKEIKKQMKLWNY